MREIPEEEKQNRKGRDERQESLLKVYTNAFITCLFFSYFYSVNTNRSQNAPQFGLF